MIKKLVDFQSDIGNETLSGFAKDCNFCSWSCATGVALERLFITLFWQK